MSASHASPFPSHRSPSQPFALKGEAAVGSEREPAGRSGRGEAAAGPLRAARRVRARVLAHRPARIRESRKALARRRRHPGARC